MSHRAVVATQRPSGSGFHAGNFIWHIPARRLPKGRAPARRGAPREARGLGRCRGACRGHACARCTHAAAAPREEPAAPGHGVWWDGSGSCSPRGRGLVWAPSAGGTCGRIPLTWHPGPAAIPLPRRGARHVPAVLGPFPRLTTIPSSQPIPNPGLDRFSSAPAPAQLPALLPASPRVPMGLGALLTGIRSSPALFSPVAEHVELPGAPTETFPVLQQPLHYPAGPTLSHLQSRTTAWHGGLQHTSLSHPIPIP